MKKEKGFSLVELIVVIAIMAILLGILTPALINQLEKSKRSKDKVVLDNIATAVQTGVLEEYIFADFLLVADHLPYTAYLSDIKTLSEQAEGANGKIFGDAVIGTLTGTEKLYSKKVKNADIYEQRVVRITVDDDMNILVEAVATDGTSTDLKVKK